MVRTVRPLHQPPELSLMFNYFGSQLNTILISHDKRIYTSKQPHCARLCKNAKNKRIEPDPTETAKTAALSRILQNPAKQPHWARVYENAGNHRIKPGYRKRPKQANWGRLCLIPQNNSIERELQQTGRTLLLIMIPWDTRGSILHHRSYLCITHKLCNTLMHINTDLWDEGTARLPKG